MKTKSKLVVGYSWEGWGEEWGVTASEHIFFPRWVVIKIFWN